MQSSPATRFISISILITLFIVGIECIRFTLEPNTRRCLKEEMRQNVVVSGSYDLPQIIGQTADFQITDAKGHLAVNRENIDKGVFSLIADENEFYDICFISHANQGYQAQAREVFLEIKHGVETKNYEEIAQIGKLKPLELELTKIEDLSSSIVADFEYMKKREQEMRDTNESTNSRVLHLSIFAMLILLGLATWQVLYLKKFFKTKKLID